MSDENGLPKGWAKASLDAVGTLHCGQSPSVSEVNHDADGTPLRNHRARPVGRHYAHCR